MSMRTARSVWAAALAAAIGISASPAGLTQADASCDRACLQGFADQYLEALVAHDPSKAPLAENLKSTENGQEIRPGDGLWIGASANSKYRLYIADPATQQVAFIGAIQEHGLPVLIALRLKVAGGKITESENIVSRVNPGGLGKPENFTTPHPLFTTALPPAKRTPRDQMIKIADSYFTGLDTEESGRNVPFDKRCQRRENGTVTANNPDPKASPMARLGCKAQFDTGFSVIVTDVRERRFPIVDEERGLVYAVVFFDHRGNVESYGRPDGTVAPVDPRFRRPMTFMIGELFQIESGRIRQIEAILQEVPYGMPSGWSEK